MQPDSTPPQEAACQPALARSMDLLLLLHLLKAVAKEAEKDSISSFRASPLQATIGEGYEHANNIRARELTVFTS